MQMQQLSDFLQFEAVHYILFKFICGHISRSLQGILAFVSEVCPPLLWSLCRILFKNGKTNNERNEIFY